ncbi:TPA: winged helix-turn-helix domain-containing protein [Salmonella enterica]
MVNGPENQQPESIVIDGDINFTPMANCLKNVSTGETEELGHISSLLLLHLLINREQITRREEIFNNVFIPYGAKATDPNLNQHILFIRKALTAVGYKDDLIITVPKIGFKVNQCTITFVSPANDVKQSGMQKRGKTKGEKKTIIFYGAAIMVLFISVTTAAFFRHQDKVHFEKINIKNELKYDQCNIKQITNEKVDKISPADVKRILLSMEVRPDCTRYHDVYYFQNSNATNTLKWGFTAVCSYDLGHYNCDSYYTYEQKK